MARDKTSSGARRRRWPWVLLGFGVLAFVLVGLALLARPMMDVKPEADAARDELGMAQDALKAEDLDAAKVHVAAARAHVDEASTLVNGFGGDVWRWVPVGGGAIQDVRHLVGALDQATAIAEIGTEVYPELMQSDSLVQNAQVDLDQLDGILTSLNQAGLHLHAAVDDLEAVDGDTPFIGDKVLEARDQAWDKIEPISTTYDEAEPVLDALPDVLGADGDRTYIVAIMNPAELRYSGGATLTLVPMTMSDGKVEFGDTVTNQDIVADGVGKYHWPKVKGNPFHTPGKRVVMSATFSPYWSQSGEELLRAWEARFGQKPDGVITVDLQALARLMELTGPVQAEGVGELNSGNLVKVLAGSYDYYDSEEERREINAAVVPAFREKLFEGGHFADKFETRILWMDDEEMLPGRPYLIKAGPLTTMPGLVSTTPSISLIEASISSALACKAFLSSLKTLISIGSLVQLRSRQIMASRICDVEGPRPLFSRLPSRVRWRPFPAI